MEDTYETYQLWEASQDCNLEYSSKIFSVDELREEAVTNKWLSEDAANSIDTESLVNLFENYGFTVWRV